MAVDRTDLVQQVLGLRTELYPVSSGRLANGSKSI